MARLVALAFLAAAFLASTSAQGDHGSTKAGNAPHPKNGGGALDGFGVVGGKNKCARSK
jgi:hypothetical protein